MRREYKLFVKDILDAIERIERFTGRMGFEEFLADEKTKSAVMWQLMVIGEAAKNIPEHVRKAIRTYLGAVWPK